MKLSKILGEKIDDFKNAGVPTPVLDAEVLVSHVLNIDRARLITQDKKNLVENEINEINKLCRRRLNGEPVAYIINKKEFYSLDFYVDRNVMIPRPETELVVDLAIFYAKQEGSLLDLGTGSGAIAVSIKHNRWDLNIFASDVSEKALKIAKKNTNTLLKGNAINFFCGDLFSPFKNEKFDIIVSNPPYINPERKNSLQKELSFEPEAALFSEDKGRAVIKKIIKGGRDYLNKEGKMIIEISEEMEEFIKKEGDGLGYKASVLSDYAGLPRVAVLK